MLAGGLGLFGQFDYRDIKAADLMEEQRTFFEERYRERRPAQGERPSLELPQGGQSGDFFNGSDSKDQSEEENKFDTEKMIEERRERRRQRNL